MRELKLIKDVVFGMIFLTFFGYFLLVYPFAFNFELYMHGHYFGVVIAGIAMLSYGLFSLFNSGSGTLGSWTHSASGVPGTPDLTGSLILLFFAVGYVYFPSCRGNEYLVNASVAGVCLVLLRSMSLSGLRVLLVFVAAGGLLELVLALVTMQERFSGEAISITGSLHNSGVLAVFLVIQLPLLWYAIDVFSRKWMARRGRQLRLVLFCPVFLLVLGICIYSKSRMALVTTGVLAILAAGGYPKKVVLQLPVYIRVVSAVLVLSAVVLCGYYFYRLKEGSSIGRLLILDVSLRHLPDHFWLGTGLGRFSWYYPQWQAGYFLVHSRPEGPFFLSAGESYVAFNEFLELFETFGLLGSTLILPAFAWLFTAISVRNRQLLSTCKATVVAILSCCCFHYPLHQSAVLLILALCFSIVAAIRENDPFLPKPGFPKKWVRLSGVLVVALAVAVFLTGYRQYAAMEKWQLIRDDDRAERDTLKNEALGCYNNLYLDGKFLAEYGAFLARDPTDLNRAIAMAEASRQRFISWTSIEDLAYYYLQQKDYTSAIRTFEWLSEYVPNRYRPRWELLELYKRTQHPDSAIRTASFILAMPVKIPSDEVSEIKKEAESLIKSSQ